MKFGADLWPVEVDAGELELAMLNLCVNARDAIAGGGSITITAENLQEAGEDGLLTHFVKLSIVDTGCGMPPEVLARVFEPFFTTKDVGKGSGLGLPQVYGFAQQSGGRLTINSEVGVGTTVALLLPRSLRQPADPKTVDASRASSVRSDGTRRGQLLLVEDDDEVAALTREMLSSLGFSVIHARVRRRVGRAGECTPCRHRALRYHDARWRQWPGARSRNQATAAEPAHRADHRLC
jgi:hypothetical protein